MGVNRRETTSDCFEAGIIITPLVKVSPLFIRTALRHRPPASGVQRRMIIFEDFEDTILAQDLPVFEAEGQI